jgi:hypothetical protein
LAINFPDNPTVGQTFTAANRTWTYNGSAWVGDYSSTGNADTIDGIDSSQFLRSDTSDIMTGSLTITGDVNIADRIIHSGDTNTQIRFPAADTVTVETSGTERLRITSAGNVGIGTSSPATRLDIGGGQVLSFGNIAYGVVNNVAYPDIAGGAGGLLFANKNYGASAVGLGFYNSGTYEPTLTARPNHFIGIGLSSPSNQLHLHTTSTSNILQLTNSATGTGAGDGMQIVTSSLEMQLRNREAGPTTFYTSNTERMRITSTGNVGIGTTNPTTTLQVNGTITATSYAGDGSNLTGISAGATGGGTDQVFYENDVIVNSSYTITTGKNAMTAGPIEIANGATVTIPDGSEWTIV